MKVLLTGASGFIGSHVARELVERGVAVRAVVREGSSRERIEDLADRLETVTLDLFSASEAELARLAEGTEVCIHAAWYAVPGEYLGSPENLRCVDGSLRLLGALSGAGCRRAAFIGSCFEYDFDPGYLSESGPVRPRSLYAAAKLATRFLGEQVAAARGTSWAWIRLFYQYGPFEDRRRLVPHVIETLMRGEPVPVTRGLQVRDFLHVRDVASAVVAVALGQLEGVVNVGSGQPVTVRQIVATLESLLGRPGAAQFGARPDNPTDPPFVCANNRRLVEATGWSPRYDLAGGLAETVEWTRRRSGTA